MGREKAKFLAIPCDKNHAWEQVSKIVALWINCIDKDVISQKQIDDFKDMLTGLLMVEHDKGETVKMSKADRFCSRDNYTILRRAMDFGGISVDNMSACIRKICMYPSGDFKVEHADKTVECL